MPAPTVSSRATWKQSQAHLKRFARDFNHVIADVAGTEIDDGLRGLRHDGPRFLVAPGTTCAPRSERFSPSRAVGDIYRELPTEAQSVPKSKVAEDDVKILTPDEMRRILGEARVPSSPTSSSPGSPACGPPRSSG